MREWKVILDAPKYLVSNTGLIYSVRAKRILSAALSGAYLRVSLATGGSYKNKRVHRLVAEAFIPNPGNLPYVDHIDQDTLNNTVQNLRWISNSGNQRNTKRPAVKCFTREGTPVRSFDCQADAADWLISNGCTSLHKSIIKNICGCCIGNNPTAYGYVWLYIDSSGGCNK